MFFHTLERSKGLGQFRGVLGKFIIRNGSAIISHVYTHTSFKMCLASRDLSVGCFTQGEFGIRASEC